MWELGLVVTLIIFAHIWHVEGNVTRSLKYKPMPRMLVGRKGRIATTSVHSCSSMIYCQGDLLDTVQRQRLYQDSKRFVDMSLKNSEKVTLENFNQMMLATNKNPSKSDVQSFVDKNFEFIDETELWTPTDYNPSPAFLQTIKNADIQEFAQMLVSFWPRLGRRVKKSVRKDPTRHSLIPLPEGFVVPGGRFLEVYYWDSYWIVKGLLISEMKTTVKGILNNFIFLIEQYGFIPNGSRIYYINRSQPPLFASMVGLYLEYTDDIAWLKSNVDFIETEMHFWLTQRTLNITKDGVVYQLAHYGTLSNTPRPESYGEDLDTCAHADEDDKHACYNALKTGAETGWDFSTRWIFDENGKISTNLSLIDSQRVIPVDLNAYLCKSFRLLEKFYGKIGNFKKQNKWASQARQWQKNIELFLYNDADGIWYDYDYNLNVQRPHFYPSNFAPLWAECYNLKHKVKQGMKAVKYVRKMGLLKFQGGVPTSFENSGEQWDMPNAWSPLQELVVLGLYQTGYPEAQDIAETIAHRWISSNMKGYKSTGAMFEKYDAVVPGLYGSGGEYEVQIGFGWSNGVGLSFITTFSSASLVQTLLSKNLYISIFIILELI